MFTGILFIHLLAAQENFKKFKNFGKPEKEIKTQTGKKDFLKIER